MFVAHVLFTKVQKRALHIIHPVLRYPEALLTSGFTELHARRDHLCFKTFEMIKKPQSRLNHLIPPIRACAQGRSLQFSDSVIFEDMPLKYQMFQTFTLPNKTWANPIKIPETQLQPLKCNKFPCPPTIGSTTPMPRQ